VPAEETDTTTADDLRDAVLAALEAGVPLVARPFAAVARSLGVEESDVLAAARELRGDRAFKALGAVFEPGSLGYCGTLAAVSVPDEDAEDVAQALAEQASVTHVFEREDRYNIWFVVTAEGKDRLRAVTAAVVAAVGAEESMSLADERIVKLTVDFNVGAASAIVPATLGEVPPGALTREDRALARLLLADVPLTERPFRELASTLVECGYDVDEEWTLERVAEWASTGALMRVASLGATHRAALPVTALVQWPLTEGGSHASSASAVLAANPAVTHCYRVPPALVTRPTVAALVHAASREAAEAAMTRLCEIPGLDTPRVAFGVRETKRAPLRYFAEGDG
jgi:DNA-binding Lrp family transcriptional regulator